MQTFPRPMPTLGEICRRYQCTVHQTLYAINKLKIQPIGRAGVANVYSESDVERIGGELRRIAERRTAGSTSSTSLDGSK